jgi:hypothetical protein
MWGDCSASFGKTNSGGLLSHMLWHFGAMGKKDQVPENAKAGGYGSEARVEWLIAHEKIRRLDVKD